MALPNLAGLALHAAAPTQEFVTLDDKQAERLNRGEENREDGREPLTLEKYKAGEYFRVRKPPPQGGEPRDELFDYDYFDPAKLWRAARTNRENPVNRQRISDSDYDDLRDRFSTKREREEEREDVYRRWILRREQLAREAALRGMTLEQYQAFLQQRRRSRSRNSCSSRSRSRRRCGRSA